MACEVTIKVKDSLKAFSQKTIVHDEITASYDDDTISRLIEDAKKHFEGEPTKITVSIKVMED